MRSIAPELPVTRPLSPRPVHPSSRALETDTWSTLAAQVAETTDRDLVAAAVVRLGAVLDVEVDLEGDIVVLQRAFGALHRRAAA